MKREHDPRPAPTESLGEWIDRMICGRPAGRLWWVWGWIDLESLYRTAGFFEPSYVHHPSINYRIQG